MCFYIFFYCNILSGFLFYLLGGEWDYVIFSLVRFLFEYRIEFKFIDGWCKENLGFINDDY